MDHLNYPAFTVEIVRYVEEVRDNWTTPIKAYLQDGTLLPEKQEARKLICKASEYIPEHGELYLSSYLQPLIRCVWLAKANYIIKELHEGACISYAGPKAISKKILW